MKNILILNAGTRNKLIRYFKETINGQAAVIATDSYYLAPAIYEADKFYITEHYSSDNYWNCIDSICDENNIGLILSLIDPELELLAKRKDYYATKGILVNSAEYEVVHSCFDKETTLSRIKEHNLPYIKTYSNISEIENALKTGNISYPLFFKPRLGSGSLGIAKIESWSQLLVQCKHFPDFLVQEYMGTNEFGVDVYVDLISGEVISIFAKQKLKMRSGETDKSVSYINQVLFNMITDFVKVAGLKGVNDIDVFEKDGIFYISEVNPRFGGGYLHAYECGINFPQMLINNMNGITNKPDIGNYKNNVYMMKYFDIQIMEK